MATVNAYDRTAQLAELNTPYDIGSGQVTPAVQKAALLSNMGLTAGAAGAGTVTTATTTAVVEQAIGNFHVTTLTFTNFAVGTSGDNASLGIGAKFYTFPSGTIIVDGVQLKGGITAAVSVTAQTPEVAVGSVIASGAIASTTTTMEDYIDGGSGAGLIGGDNTAPDVAGTVFYKGGLSTSSAVLVKTSGGKTHDLFLNVAVAWADVTAAGAVTFSGTIQIKWRKLAA